MTSLYQVRSSATPIRWTVVILLSLYAIVFIYPPGLVPHGDHDHSTHDADTCFKDACHIAIYHQGHKGACEHKFHFTNGYPDCLQCKLVFTNQLAQDTENILEIFTSQPLEIIQSSHSYLQDCQFDVHSRGPPPIAMT